ncbi:unnamed protein product [Symbiodinium sp. CCMP2592]|nr:unnamed protein product [Symbiodinium sp. CCMP2592]
MMLDHDSPLVQPSAAPDIAPESTVEPLPRLSEVPQPAPLRRIDLVFEQKGSLGIEFKELAAPFVIEQVHSTGLAYNRDLQKGDQLILVGGEDVTKLAWDELVQKLGPRPVLVTFERPDAVEEEPTPATFMSGLGSTMRSLGGSVMEQGLDLGKMGIAGGLEIGTKGLELGSKLSSAGMGFGSKETAADAPAPTENGVQDHLQQDLAQSQEAERLQLEVRRLLPFEEASKELEARLKEAELQLEQRSQALTELERQRAADSAAIQGLKGDLASIHETGASQAGQLESALRERDEAQQKLQEAMQRSQENLQAADAGRALSMENEALQQELLQSREASKELQARLQEVELQLEQRSQAMTALEHRRAADAPEPETFFIGDDENTQVEDAGAAQAQQLESALRERDEAQQKLQELLEKSQENLQAADASHALSMENETLQQQLAQSREASKELHSRLQEAELQLEQRSQAMTALEQHRAADASTIQQLQGDLSAIQGTGTTQAQQLESALRERDEAQQQLQELLQRSQENLQAADASRALSMEKETLQQELAQSREASKELQSRLQEAELQLEQRSQAMVELEQLRVADSAAVQRLQGDLASIQETGASQAGQLESALRERDEAQQKLQDGSLRGA